MRCGKTDVTDLCPLTCGEDCTPFDTVGSTMVGIGIVIMLQTKLPEGATIIIFEAIAPLPVQGILTIEKVDAMHNYISIC